MLVANAPFMQSLREMLGRAYDKGWHERNGGNLSYRLSEEDLAAIEQELLPVGNWQTLTAVFPELAGISFVITAKGAYMRRVASCPQDNLAIITLDQNGSHYALRWGLNQGGHPSSELPMHLLSHVAKRNSGGRVIYHCHPPNIIALSFVLPPESKLLTGCLWRMMPECAMVFPKGIGVLPWQVPGTLAIARASAQLMQKHHALLWSQHGLFGAGADFDETFGLMETIEKAAEIYVKVLSMGGVKYVPSDQQIKELDRQLKLGLDPEMLN